MNNYSENTERKETAMKKTPKKSNPGSMVRTAIGCEELSIVWASGKHGVFSGMVGRQVRFEVVRGKFDFSLFDAAAPLGYQFIENYSSFSDASEAAILALDLERQQTERALARTAALVAFAQLELTA